MPVVMTGSTLSSLWCLGQRTASGAIIKRDFPAVLIENPLSGLHHERIKSLACQLQNLGVIR
jgi:hypothetical protein